MCAYYVYIMASKRNGTLYVGSTNDLVRRAWEHKQKLLPTFTSKYDVQKLVYYEIHEEYFLTAQREKRFKKWCRKWKLELIENMNPNWCDLYNEICF